MKIRAAGERGKISIPPNCHPLVRQLMEAANTRGLTFTKIGEVSGVDRTTISGWRRNSLPSVELFEAALNSVGLELRVGPHRRGSAQ